MCGRFALVAHVEALEETLGLVGLEPFPPRYNIAPTQPIVVVAAAPARPPGSNLPDRRALLVRWGFIPSWTKDPAKLPLMINARSETAAEKASFRAALRHRRVLIPASGFYEWKRAGRARPQPYWVRPRNAEIVTFGGLIETYLDANGSEIDTGAILTTAASGEIAAIHDRMPAIIQPEHRARWLDCVRNEPRDVEDAMAPVGPGFFEAVPVSDKVNKVANTEPEIQERVEIPPEPAKSVPQDAQFSLF